MKSIISPPPIYNTKVNQMAEYIILFDRAYMPIAKLEGKIEEVRAFVGEEMFRPVSLRGKKVLLSRAVIWYAKKGTFERSDRCAGIYEMGVLNGNGKEVRIGMWCPAPKFDKAYALKRDGTIATEFSKWEMESMFRKEMRTRAQRVKNM